MIGLDTNVLLRLALRDDEEQFARAFAFVQGNVTEETPAYINIIVLSEFAWTLRRVYKRSMAETLGAIEKLINSPSYLFQSEDLVLKSLQASRQTGIELPDALIANLNQDVGCVDTFTFDAEFVKSGEASFVP